MSSLTMSELKVIEQGLNSLKGSQWDRFFIDGQSFAMGFWTGNALLWYVGSMSATSPFVLPVERAPQKVDQHS